MVYEVLGKLIPENELPLNVKTAVNNVSTVLNIYRASLGIPVTERALTITGEVNNCGNYILPLGTTIRDALDFAGGLKTYPFTVISGGPMMGEIVKDLSTPVIKTTGGLIVLPVKHPLITRKEKDILHEFKSANSACDQCRYCTDLCPRFLLGHEMEPHKVMQALAHSTNEEELSRSFLCCGCQVCSYYACPLFLSPGKILQKIRMDLVKNKIKNTYCKSGLKTSMFRNFRKLPFNRLVARLGLADYAANLKSYFNKSFFPKKVILPLKQHAGSPAKPIVEKNQKVEKGNLIAEIQENNLGANIHASIDGVIENISEYSITIKSC